MNFQDHQAQIQSGKLNSIYLVLGTEDFLMQEMRKTFLEKIIPAEDQELNVGVYNMEDVAVQEALMDAESLPFFGDRRIVLVDRPYFLTGERDKAKIDHDLDYLSSYLSTPALTTTLVICAPYEKLDSRKKIVKELKKTATTISVAPLDEKEIRKFLSKQIQDRGYSIEDSAFQQLLIKTDASLSKALKELDKLYLASLESRRITIDLLNELIPKTLEENIFELVDAILKKQSARALGIYHDLLIQKEDPIKMNAILVGQFRLLLQTSYLSQKGFHEPDLPKILGSHPYRIKLALKEARNYKLDDLEKAFSLLVETEYAMKSGIGKKEIQFELFILKFCQGRKG